MEYIAHIRNEDGHIQSVEEHLMSVSKLSARYGKKIGVERLAYIAGLLHDSGKLSTQFRDYILEAVNNPNHPPKKGSVDHSTAGGKILFEYFHHHGQNVPMQIIAEILGNVILSHHMGLQDFLSPDTTSTYMRRVKEKEINDIDRVKDNFFQLIAPLKSLTDDLQNSKNELTDVLTRNNKRSQSKNPYLTMTFLTKYIFSCLIDADRTDSRCFEEDINVPESRNNNDLFNLFYQRLTEHLNSLNNDVNINAIDRLREQMSEECDKFADRPSGIYTLSIPTGGGKTLSSLRYALKHAAKFSKDRIIYVVPYTSIIEQNAAEVREILKEDEHILEHHSNVIKEDEDKDAKIPYQKRKTHQLTKDNWEVPIIFTTMVQFLNTFYSKGTRDIRRFHNLANTVIIFDEVQAVPVKCISMFNEALNYLRNVCNSSILLCTATQPALEFVEDSIDGIDGEIVPNLDKVTDHFKRVEIVDRTRHGGWNTEELSYFVLDVLNESSSVLVILNTKTVVKKLFNQLSKNEDTVVYHLSTSMCAAHRTAILAKVKSTLQSGAKVICISTQLIEAGVNISFDCVIRSLAGLDSIAQAAGRCNRHGEHEQRNVYVVNHKEENLNYLKTIKAGAEITERMLIDKQNGNISKDLLSAEVMNLYFKNYYTELENELGFHVPSLKENLYNLLAGSETYKQHYKNKTGEHFPLQLYTSMKTVGDHFQVIDQQATSIIVPYKGGADIIAELNGDVDLKKMSSILKKSQQYVVNVFKYELQELSNSGDLIPLLDGRILALRENAYDLNYGISVGEEGKMAPHIL
ncbi:CRISPR-associated helicase Cas3' [Metallumcola ferriviriculae]|uniref:CRISPR-associated helicase Cas3 n=1 Tax=Metallumcola ferriviriculae TaxID=3039180 RepID=A0AAU0US80_9FIRM|nr:CRISPR-associated helicase Cas3' [Desulfitibacteraceae bacterium MK1]